MATGFGKGGSKSRHEPLGHPRVWIHRCHRHYSCCMRVTLFLLLFPVFIWELGIWGYLADYWIPLGFPSAEDYRFLCISGKFIIILSYGIYVEEEFQNGEMLIFGELFIFASWLGRIHRKRDRIAVVDLLEHLFKKKLGEDIKNVCRKSTRKKWREWWDYIFIHCHWLLVYAFVILVHSNGRSWWISSTSGVIVSPAKNHVIKKWLWIGEWIEC